MPQSLWGCAITSPHTFRSGLLTNMAAAFCSSSEPSAKPASDGLALDSKLAIVKVVPGDPSKVKYAGGDDAPCQR